MAEPDTALLRQIPAVATVLATSEAAGLIDTHGRAPVTDAIRDVLAGVRAAMAHEALSVPAPADIVREAGERLAARRASLRTVFNLTGTVLHTNLGRAQLADSAVDAAVQAMRYPVSLEYSLDAGSRGERDDHVRGLLRELTGAEDATVVNNNAAAVLLCLNTFALRREAIVSRGELVEIGGAFRMPDIITRAGADMVEVGTTNRTHAADYRDALSERTGLVLKVHTSNYRIQGFTAGVDARELAAIADEAGVPLLNDLGSGSLVDLSRHGLAKEPTVREAVAEGARLVMFSGDKLLGGPQAGFIVGDATLIAQINRNPLKRALRVDKMRLAAIEATLRLYRDPDRLGERLPTLRYLTRETAAIRTQAERLLPDAAVRLGTAFEVDVAPCLSQIGSGALPLDTLQSAALRIRARGSQTTLEQFAVRLRNLPRPVIGRIADGALHFDLRCLDVGDETAFLDALAAGSAGHP